MQIPVRFKVIFMSFLAVFICYIDRVNISVAIIPMQDMAAKLFLDMDFFSGHCLQF